MRLMQVLVGALALTVMFVTTTPSAYAASEVGTPGDIGVTVNPNANGTKLNGFLTIAYDSINPADPACSAFGAISADMTVVLNLNLGNTQATFSAGGVDAQGHPARVCVADTGTQGTIIENFVSTEVIGFFFAPVGTPAQPCSFGPCWEVKSLTNVNTSKTPTTQQSGFSLNVVLAVHP